MIDYIQAYFRAVEKAGDTPKCVAMVILAGLVLFITTLLTTAIMFQFPILVVPILGSILYFMYLIAKKEMGK